MYKVLFNEQILSKITTYIFKFHKVYLLVSHINVHSIEQHISVDTRFL